MLNKYEPQTVITSKHFRYADQILFGQKRRGKFVAEKEA